GFVYRSSRLELSLAAFYNQIDDYILIQSNYPKGMRRVSVTRNVDAWTVGAEADAAYALGAGWKLTGALAYTRGENETDRSPISASCIGPRGSSCLSPRSTTRSTITF